LVSSFFSSFSKVYCLSSVKAMQFSKMCMAVSFSSLLLRLRRSHIVGCLHILLVRAITI
jgi:hypothetical protein